MTTCTQSELARRAGVSQKTVNLALRGAAGVNTRTRERICALASELGYRPNAGARALVSRRSYQIGVVLPVRGGREFHNPLHYETVSGINRELQSAGYVLCLARLDDLSPEGFRQNRLLHEQFLDGLILLDLVPDELESELAVVGFPILRVEGNRWTESGCLRRDEEDAGRVVGNHVLEAGFHRIIWYSYPLRADAHFSHAARLAGLRSAAVGAGLEIIEINDVGALPDFLQSGTAVVADSSSLAEQAALFCGSRGLRPGIDFGLACCDESSQVRGFWPALSRVSFRRHDLGQEAARMLLSALDEPFSLPPSRVIRGEWIAGSTLKAQ